MAESAEAAAPPPTAETLKAIEKRWSKDLAKVGWTALPNIILEKQVALELEPIDVNILMQIAKHWWSEEAPFPSIERIAIAIGVTPRTVQRRITKMEKAKLIERKVRRYARGGQKSNGYSFDGLIKKCIPFAIEALNARAKRVNEDRARVRRSQPLTVVK
jgi:DNA-binding transcriptional ArsR family regulator